MSHVTDNFVFKIVNQYGIKQINHLFSQKATISSPDIGGFSNALQSLKKLRWNDSAYVSLCVPVTNTVQTQFYVVLLKDHILSNILEMYSKTCHTRTRVYVDTHPTVDKILCTDRILSIYPLIRGQTCHAWMVDTKKCTVEQNYLLICGHLAISSGRCHSTFNEIGLRWHQFIHKEGKDQREKCQPHI